MIKNNNPGNIRRVQGQKWQGEIIPSPFVPGFSSFVSLEYGYRALLKLLNNYIGKGFNNIEKIITRWAPPSENNTAAYIDWIEKDTGIGRHRVLFAGDFYTLAKIAKSISEIEHSGNLTASDINGLNTALANINTTTPAPSVNTAGFDAWPLIIILILALLAQKNPS